MQTPETDAGFRSRRGFFEFLPALLAILVMVFAWTADPPERKTAWESTREARQEARQNERWKNRSNNRRAAAPNDRQGEPVWPNETWRKAAEAAVERGVLDPSALEPRGQNAAADDTSASEDASAAGSDSAPKASARNRRWANNTKPERQRPKNLLTNEEAERAGPGNWRRVRQRDEDGLTPAQQEEIKRLESLGYLTGSREVGLSGVLRHDEEASQPGFSIYTSGHEASAMMIDAMGKVRFRWQHDWKKTFPDDTRRSFEGMEWWCWVHPYETGELLAVFSGAGMVKLDARSRVIWSHPNNAHHDLDVAEDGTIYVLTRISHMIPRLNEEEPILEDFVTILNADGSERKSFSLIAAFEDTDYEFEWRSKHWKPKGDTMHTNAVVLLDGSGADRIPGFRKGNLLVSIRQSSLLAAVNPETEKVEWASKGPFRLQHDPHVLDNGNILLFDNSGAGEGVSRALELDPTDMSIAWEFRGTPEEPMWSQFMGAVERLENGNTLITESEGGRILEVTPDKKVVWEYYTPHRSGDDNEFIASICRARRLPEDFGSKFKG